MPWDDVFVGATELTQQIRKVFGFHAGSEASRL